MTMGGLFDRVKPSDAGRGCKIENRAPAAGRARPALCGIKRQDVEVGTIAGRQGGSGLLFHPWYFHLLSILWLVVPIVSACL